MTNLRKDSLNLETVNVVKYYSKSCAPCALLTQQLENLQDANLISIDAESEDIDTLMEYGIRKLPTTLIFKGNEYVTKISGPDFDAIQSEVNKLK